MAPSNISPLGACTWKIALKKKVKQSQNGKFHSNYKASPIDYETRISLHRLSPPKISPSKRAFQKNISPGAYFRNFTVSCHCRWNTYTLKNFVGAKPLLLLGYVCPVSYSQTPLYGHQLNVDSLLLWEVSLVTGENP